MCGRPNEPHPAALLPLPQFVEHAVLAKYHIWVVAPMNVFDEENVNHPDTQEGGQLSPRPATLPHAGCRCRLPQ
jgi:hypothetical protein